MVVLENTVLYLAFCNLNIKKTTFVNKFLIPTLSLISLTSAFGVKLVRGWSLGRAHVVQINIKILIFNVLGMIYELPGK